MSFTIPWRAKQDNATTRWVFSANAIERYAFILVTTPTPPILPPSRIPKRKCSYIAIEATSFTLNVAVEQLPGFTGWCRTSSQLGIARPLWVKGGHARCTRRCPLADVVGASHGIKGRNLPRVQTTSSHHSKAAAIGIRAIARSPARPNQRGTPDRALHVRCDA